MDQGSLDGMSLTFLSLMVLLTPVGTPLTFDPDPCAVPTESVAR